MKIKTVALLLFLWLLTIAPGRSQTGFEIPEGLHQVEIPFEYVNNFIILNIAFNGPLPLKFIYDTGAEHTILTKREISDILQVRYDREFRVKGSDLTSELVAYLARNIRLQIMGKEVIDKQEDILVLKDDYFRFEEYAGVEVHGILAGRVFANYLIKINYQKHIITLHKRGTFYPDKNGFENLPVELYRNKFYLKTAANLRPDTSAAVKLLLDTGAGMPLMLFTNTHPLIHPAANAIPSNIGMGLGGYLEGYVGRTPGLTLGNLQQQQVLTYYQAVDTMQDLSYLNGRNGLIGNAILSRYQVCLDYQSTTVWLKPTKHVKQAFLYDRSGLNLIASGLNLNYFTVLNVLPGSPADEIGIHAGDRIMRIGFWPAGMHTLSELQTLLQQKPGKKVKVVIKRDGKIIKKVITLRDLI